MTRVLVVEDEESYSDALAYMLRKEGFEVAIAADGTDALTEFDRNGADIVLLDLMLPGMPGTEVCRQIRQTSNVPIIMVSAKDNEIDKVVGLEIGRRRLRHQAVLAARAGRPDPRRAAPRRSEPELAPATLEAGPGPDGRRAARGHRRRPGAAAAAQGVRAARDVPAQPRPGAHPRAADRPGVGLGLRRRHQDPRRAREAAARQDRAGPGRARSTSSPCAGWATSSTSDALSRTAAAARRPRRARPGRRR